MLTISKYLFSTKLSITHRIHHSDLLPVAIPAAAQTRGLHVSIQIECGLIIVRGLRRVRGTTRTTNCCDGRLRGARRDHSLLGLARDLTTAVRCSRPRMKLLRADVLTGRIRRASIVTRVRSEHHDGKSKRKAYRAK